MAKTGEVRYFLLGGGGPGGGIGRGGGSSLQSWIQAHSTKVTVSGTTLYRYTG